MTDDKWANHPRVVGVSHQGELPAESEKYTEEQQKRRAFRSNKPFFPKQLHFNSQASSDAIKHFVHGIGDENPLFCNKEYALKSKYGTIIAPGSFLYSVLWTIRGAGPSGLHGWYVGGDWEWYRPILAGDEFRVVCIIKDMVEKKGRMGAGRTWIDYDDVIYINQNGQIVGKEHQHIVRAERAASGSAGRYRSVPKTTYTKDDWIKILDAYDREEVRGSKPRFWDDVQVGDKLGPMIKGPLSVRDEIAWLIGGGSIYFKAHGIQYRYEARHPKELEYVKELGEADVPELVHIFDEYARAIGVERAYDYGCQRMSWLCNLLTNWMGDDGFLWKMSGDLRAFNQIGDVTTFEGEVVKTYVEDGKHCVDVAAWAKNQRDEWSMPAHTSTIVLPCKEQRDFSYFEPAPALKEEITRARPLDELLAKGLI